MKQPKIPFFNSLASGTSERSQIKQPKIPFLKTRVPYHNDRLTKGEDTWPMRNETYVKGKESEKHGIEDANKREDLQSNNLV